VDLDLNVGYRPFGHQVAFHESNARFKGAFSGNRGGKTLSGAYEFIRRIFFDLQSGKGRIPAKGTSKRLHRLLYWIVAPNYRLGKTSLETVERLLPYKAIVDSNKTENAIWLVGGVKIELRSAEDPRHLVADSLNGIWIDEAPRVKAEAWRGALRARLADQLGWLIATGSPLGGRDCWAYIDLVSQSGTGGIETFTWTTEQNPYIPRSEVQWAKDRLPAAHYKRDWQASWDAHGGVIFDEFDESLHVVSESELRLRYGHALRGGRDIRTLFQRVVGAIDWGWQAPGCLLVIGKVSDDDVIVLEESYAPGRRVLGNDGVTWLSECHRLKQKWGIEVFACDPESPGEIAALADNGINAFAANNRRLAGIRRVAEAMHPYTVNGTRKAGLTVLSSCTNLLREIRSYTWKSNREQTAFFDEPADNQSDHAVDPLRYGLLEINPVSVMERFRTQRPGWRPPG